MDIHATCIDISALSAELFSEFGTTIPGYYLNALVDASRMVDLRGKRVLEIGGSSLPRRLVFDCLGVSKWVCVDLLDHASGRYQASAQADHYREIGVLHLADAASGISTEPYVIYDGSAADLSEAFEGEFDVVFSVNSFEHISDLDCVLECAYAALTPGGLLFSQFGPIWSCRVGSHFWVNDKFNFTSQAGMPDWGHLRYSRQELQSILKSSGHTDDEVAQSCYQIYDSDFVNRRFFEDYEFAMRRSSFNEYLLTPLWEQPPTPEMNAELQELLPHHANFSAYGIRISASRVKGFTIPLQPPDSQAIFGLGLGAPVEDAYATFRDTNAGETDRRNSSAQFTLPGSLDALEPEEDARWPERQLWLTGAPLREVFRFATLSASSLPRGRLAWPDTTLISNNAYLVFPWLEPEHKGYVIFGHPSSVVSRVFHGLLTHGRDRPPSITALFETWCEIYEFLILISRFRDLTFISEENVMLDSSFSQFDRRGRRLPPEAAAMSRKLHLDERSLSIWDNLKKLERNA